jgi:hypothetical protein
MFIPTESGWLYRYLLWIRIHMISPKETIPIPYTQLWFWYTVLKKLLGLQMKILQSNLYLLTCCPRHIFSGGIQRWKTLLGTVESNRPTGLLLQTHQTITLRSVQGCSEYQSSFVLSDGHHVVDSIECFIRIRIRFFRRLGRKMISVRIRILFSN